LIFRIHHKTRFVYQKPASDSHNEIHLRPRDTVEQRCLSFDLAVEPAGAIASYTDFFGNLAHSVSIGTPHEELTIAAEAVVERSSAPEQIRADVPFARFLVDDGARGRDYYEYLAASQYVPFSKRLRKFFWQSHPRDYEDVSDYVARIVAEVRMRFEYEPKTTHVHSSLDDILKSGGGVCQDFAHLTIGMLRLAGVPARYVSGYLAPRGDLASS
jgi:transglutaminase-like putative cysteine protease